jgi:hypothetical protein
VEVRVYVDQSRVFVIPGNLWLQQISSAVREVFTFEAKIEHAASQQITASDIGQAHIQLARAVAEYQAQGYTIRGAIVTHLTELRPGVSSSVGGIKIVGKDAVLVL